jgi:hypothetical protein
LLILIDSYPGAAHGFYSMVPHTAAAKKLAKDLEDGVNWLLQDSV